MEAGSFSDLQGPNPPVPAGGATSKPVVDDPRMSEPALPNAKGS
jgi:hypothetical protein